jgi:trehalose 6-phosphate synthase
MSRLIVVSNRVSISDSPDGAASGGLTVALSDALKNTGGLWFGWSGKTGSGCDPFPALQTRNGVTVATMDLEAEDVAEYYNGFANSVIWPLFHHRIDLTHYERAFDDGYQRVNARFADMLAPLVQPDDVIWVHDYHLIPLGEQLRRRGVQNSIGFFLHIPWPARELMTTLPRHNEIVRALFAYDLVGFQCDAWRSAFEDYVMDECRGEASAPGRLCAFGRTLRFGVFPIGIDTKGFKRVAASPGATQSYLRAAAAGTFRSTIVAVDRVDYSKGLKERFLAYERLLEDHPELVEKVDLLQVGQPSRVGLTTYGEIGKALDAVSGRINGRFATVNWTPIRYLNRSYSRDNIAGLYRAARVGLVTPLRDGMNLVAKEYVAAQDPADPGVLILSRFAGAAAQMKAALIVNPYSREDVADAIHLALMMPKAERIERWTALMAGLERDDADAWRDSFLRALRPQTAALRRRKAA